MRTSLVVLVVVLGWTQLGCSTPGEFNRALNRVLDEAPKNTLKLVVTCAPVINPDEQGKPVPTAIHIYQLQDEQKAASVELEALRTNAVAALGGDLLVGDSLQVVPACRGEVRYVKLHDRARVVLIAAMVRSASGTSWRRIVPVANRKEHHDVQVQLAGFSFY